VLGGQLEQAHAEEALHALIVAIRELRTDGPTPPALEVAKAILRAEVRHAVASNSMLSTRLAQRAVLGRDPSDLCLLDAQIQATTGADVRRVAEDYFGDADIGIVVAGRERDVLPRLAVLGLGPPTFRDGLTQDRPAR
jgi:predicted Zn-dependent peptidase